MKTTYMINDAEWNALVQATAYHFDDLTLKRGFQYYKQGRVRKFSMEAPPVMEAVVGGREEYRVHINLDSFPLSSCACPVEGTCKHMAAVLLHFADWQNRSVPVLVNAKASAMAHVNLKSAVTAPSVSNDTANLIPEMTVTEWHGWFERSVAPLSGQVRNSQYVEGALALIYKRKPQLSLVTDQLFRLNAQLFMLELLTKPARKNPSAGIYIGYYTHLAISDLQQAIEQDFEIALPLELEPEAWARVRDTLAYLRTEMLTEARDAAHFSPCYYLLWRNWIMPNMKDKTLFTEELEQLQLQEEIQGAKISRNSWLVARSLMHFQLAEDQAAWDLLRSAADRPDFRPEDVMGFLKPLADAGEWPRLVTWLVEIGDMLQYRKFYKLDSYSLYWDLAVKELPDSEPKMWNTLAAMLPASRDVYDEKLLSYGKYQEWMDYQLAAGREPAHFRVTKLQPLEKNAPETLLPFYHQAVERYVTEKNRGSYKAAVKLMKRLQKLYKKMKQEERWESFLNAFTIRHSRLRALQEELRKGKLIP